MAVANDHAGLIVLWGAILGTGVGCASAAVPNLIICAWSRTGPRTSPSAASPPTKASKSRS
jgi:hypothetical protein